MLVNTRALNALRGQGAVPDVQDSNLTIPNIGIITVAVRDPVRALDAAPGSATEGAAFSFNVFVDDLSPASTPAHNVSMGFLAPGLWELFMNHINAIDFAPTPAQQAHVGIAMIQPPAVLASFLLSNQNQRDPAIGKVIIELDTITQIVTVCGATGVGQTSRTFAHLTANRLL